MPTYATFDEYCKTLDAIQAGFAVGVQKIAGKFRALRRLADLLQFSGASIPIPNPADLIPVNLIDFNKYQELVAICPGLLPPYTGQTLQDLQNAVEDSYQSLLNQTLTHPYNQMAELQALIDNDIAALADKVVRAVGPAIDVTSCLQAVCAAASEGNVLFGPEVIESTKAAFVQLTQDASLTAQGIAGIGTSVQAAAGEAQAAIGDILTP